MAPVLLQEERAQGLKRHLLRVSVSSANLGRRK